MSRTQIIRLFANHDIAGIRFRVVFALEDQGNLNRIVLMPTAYQSCSTLVVAMRELTGEKEIASRDRNVLVDGTALLFGGTGGSYRATFLAPQARPPN